MSTVEIQPTYYTLKEAVHLGYGSYATLRRYIKDGRLSACKIGNQYKVTRDDLEVLKQPLKPSFDALRDTVAHLIAQAPALSDEQSRELSALLQGGAQ